MEIARPCKHEVAAAYAEAGDFDAARKWQLKAKEMEGATDAEQKEMSARLELYENKKPFRDSEK